MLRQQSFDDYTGKDSTEAIVQFEQDGFVPDSYW